MSQPTDRSGPPTGPPTGPGWAGPDLHRPAWSGPAAPEMSPPDQRTWGCLAHVSALVAHAVGLPVLGPLVVYLVVKERGVFVRRQAAEALNFQILLTIIYVAALVGTVVTLGIGGLLLLPIALLVALAAFVCVILAAVDASRGIDHRYPVSWRLVR